MQSVHTAHAPGQWWWLPGVEQGRDSKRERGHSVPPKATSPLLLQTQSRDTVLTVILNELRELVYCVEGWGEVISKHEILAAPKTGLARNVRHTCAAKKPVSMIHLLSLVTRSCRPEDSRKGGGKDGVGQMDYVQHGQN